MKYKLARIVSIFFIAFFRLRYFGKVSFGKNVIVNWKFRFYGKGSLKIGDNVVMWAHEEANRFMTFSSGKIIIGDSVRLNGTTFQAKKKIEVGDRTMIASALIMDSDFHSVNPSARNENVKISAVKISNDVWIAGQAVILKGVVIAEKSTVAIRSVVTKNVPANSIVAGNPAKVVKTLE